MALYEHVLLARQDISQQQVDALVEQYKGVLEANGGKVGKVESWGLRPLTYRIKKNRKAYYTLVNIDAPAAAVAEMERQMRIKASRPCSPAVTTVANAMVMIVRAAVKVVSTVAIAVIAARVARATTKLVKEHNHG